MNDSILDTIGKTPLVRLARLSSGLGVGLYAKLEGSNPSGSIKDRIAKYMIDQAEADLELTHDKVILEPTSGNTGISLAMVACLKGYRVEVVVPESVSKERVELLQAYGAGIHFTAGDLGTNESVRVALEMAGRDKTYFMPYQYANLANPKAHYETTGREILEEMDRVDVLVAGLGTGGTLMGIGRRLKEHNASTKIVAVAPPQDDLIQGLRNVDDGFIPPILDLGLLDMRMMISSHESLIWAKELLLREGIFAGISSGAVIACAVRLAERMKNANIVCILADGGWKYLSTGLWTKDPSDVKTEIEGKVWW